MKRTFVTRSEMLKREEILKQIKNKKESEGAIFGKIGATLKMKRKLMQRTLHFLSELSGVSISYISKVENDLMRPNLIYLDNVIQYLEINEEILSESLEMNDWYNKLVKHVLEINNHKLELTKLITERQDFQSKIIEFSLLVHESNFGGIPKAINSLLESVAGMHTFEFCIFMMTLASYYIKIENHFAAGEIIKELELNYLDDNLLKLWYLEIKHELALYQSSFLYYVESAKELTFHYYSFNLLSKLKELRERSSSAFAYFLEPEKFSDYLEDEQMYRSYRLSHIYFKRFDCFKGLEKKNDLAQVLFDEISGNYKSVEKLWSNVEYNDDPFELALKEYFKYKYDFKNVELFLQETIFAGTGLSQHYYCSHFIAERLIEKFSSEHKYKQCYLLSERLKKLDNKRTLYLELKRL